MTKIPMHIEKHSEWIDSGGEPFLLASDADCLSWDNDFVNHWRASKTGHHVEILQAENKKFIIFGAEPHAVSVVYCDMGLLFLIRQQGWSENGFNVFESLESLDSEMLELLEVSDVKLESGKYFLFNAALTGNTQRKHALILDKKVPFATTFRYTPNEENSFIINNFFYRC